jgi:nucleolar pre-ribosomal-associated protein 1
VNSFLDDCIQLCLKKPYGYVEELATASSGSTSVSDDQGGANTPSPLLAAVIEQISSRFAASLCPSDAMAIISFVRRLLVRLAGKQGSLELSTHVSEKLASLPVGEVFAKKHTIVGYGITQEIKILKNYLLLFGDPAAPMSLTGTPSSTVSDFLDQVESIPIRMTSYCFLRVCSAHQCLQPRQTRCVRVQPLSLLTLCAASTLPSRRSL